MGDVIVRSWNILSRHFLTFAFLVAIAKLPPLVLTVYLRLERATPNFSTMLVTSGIGFLGFILSTFAQAIVIFAAFQDLRGRPVSAPESARQGLNRVVPVIVTSVLAGLVVGLGFVFFLIPGLIALTSLAVVVPVCVVERMGPLDSISRSSDLTTGHRWPILGVGIAWIILVLVVAALIQAAMPADPALPRQLLEWVWEVLSGSFSAVYAAILYHDLRAVREGIGIDEIASVFD